MLLSFTAPETLDVARVGGKGFGLARATQAGLPVPEGVILPTDAYRAWMAPHRDEIAARLAAHDVVRAGPQDLDPQGPAAGGGDLQALGVQPGVQGGAAEGHAQVEAGALPRGAEHLLHGANELDTGLAVRGFQHVPDAQPRHELEDRLRLVRGRAAVRAGEFVTIPRRDHVGDGAGGHVLGQPGGIRAAVPDGAPDHRFMRRHRRLRSWFGCSLHSGPGLS